jgi:hypothetical protein
VNWVGDAVALRTVPLRELVDDGVALVVGETVKTEVMTVGMQVLIVMTEREGELVNTPPAAEVETGEVIAEVEGLETTATGAEVPARTAATGVVGRLATEEPSSWKSTPSAVVVPTGAAATGASEVGVTTSAAAGVDDAATGDADSDGDEATGVDAAEATAPEDPKLLDAVVKAPLLIPTLFTMTTSPSTLVTLISAVVVPVPLDISKKLYVCRIVDCHVLPPSVLTSRVETAWLALTTCILNQNSETPSLLLSWRGDVIGQSTKSQVTSMMPVVGSASSAKAFGKRSRWFNPQPGHSSTIYRSMSMNVEMKGGWVLPWQEWSFLKGQSRRHMHRSLLNCSS